MTERELKNHIYWIEKVLFRMEDPFSISEDRKVTPRDLSPRSLNKLSKYSKLACAIETGNLSLRTLDYFLIMTKFRTKKMPKIEEIRIAEIRESEFMKVSSLETDFKNIEESGKKHFMGQSKLFTKKIEDSILFQLIIAGEVSFLYFKLLINRYVDLKVTKKMQKLLNIQKYFESQKISMSFAKDFLY